MKRIHYVFLFLILFVLQSCSDRETAPLSENNSLTRNATDIAYEGVSVDNGLFVAETNNDLREFLHYLERGDTDIDLANVIYSSLGLDKETRSSLLYYTGNPAAYKFEEDFTFRSKRRVEEDAILQKQQNSEDVFSIISKPYLKTILNEYDAFKVGDRIFRELGEGHYVVVHNNDMAKYNAIKSLPFDQLHTSHNVSFAGVDEVLFDDSDINNVKDVWVNNLDIRYFKNDLGKYTVENHSVIEYQDGYAGYEWTYEDNTTSIGIVPNRDLDEGESVNLKVVKSTAPIYSGSGGTTMTDTIIITKRDSRCDWTTEQLITVDKVTNNNVYFIVHPEFRNPVDPANTWYTITFPDENDYTFSEFGVHGIAFDGMPRYVTAILCIHFPPEPGYPEEITCCREIQIWVGECEETDEIPAEEEYPLSNGVTVKIEGLIWVETSGIFDWATPGEVGARTKVRGGLDLKCTVKLRGSFVDKDENCTVYTIDLEEWNITNDQLAINYDHEGARKFPEMLESKHYFEYNGQIYDVPKEDDEWLILD